MNTKKLIVTVFVATLLSSASFAQGNSQNAGSAGGATSNGNNDAGAIASELKGLNAAHANAAALLNTSSGSIVGRIAEYKDAAQATLDAIATSGADADNLRITALIETDIKALEDAILLLNPKSDADGIQFLKDQIEVLEAELALPALIAAEEDALAEVGGGNLTDEAYGAFRELLGLE